MFTYQLKPKSSKNLKKFGLIYFFASSYLEINSSKARFKVKPMVQIYKTEMIKKN